MPSWEWQRMPLRKRFSAPIVSWPVSIIPISTKPQAPRTNLKTSVKHTKSLRIPTNAPNMTAMERPGRPQSKVVEHPHRAMRTSGSTSVEPKILPCGEVVDLVAFLTSPLALRLGGAQPRGDAVRVALRTERRGLCPEQTEKRAWP